MRLSAIGSAGPSGERSCRRDSRWGCRAGNDASNGLDGPAGDFAAFGQPAHDVVTRFAVALPESLGRFFKINRLCRASNYRSQVARRTPQSDYIIVFRRSGDRRTVQFFALRRGWRSRAQHPSPRLVLARQATIRFLSENLRHAKLLRGEANRVRRQERCCSRRWVARPVSRCPSNPGAWPAIPGPGDIAQKRTRLRYDDGPPSRQWKGSCRGVPDAPHVSSPYEHGPSDNRDPANRPYVSEPAFDNGRKSARNFSSRSRPEVVAQASSLWRHRCRLKTSQAAAI